MTEASVSTPFMKGLRDHFGDDAVVVKHADTSMIGQLDCSVIHRGKVFWFEFKLWTPPKKWAICDPIPIEQIIAASPTQYAMAQRYDRCGATTTYIVWVRKTRKIVAYHVCQGFVTPIMLLKTTPEAVLWAVDQIKRETALD